MVVRGGFRRSIVRLSVSGLRNFAASDELVELRRSHHFRISVRGNRWEKTFFAEIDRSVFASLRCWQFCKISFPNARTNTSKQECLQACAHHHVHLFVHCFTHTCLHNCVHESMNKCSQMYSQTIQQVCMLLRMHRCSYVCVETSSLVCTHACLQFCFKCCMQFCAQLCFHACVHISMFNCLQSRHRRR